MRNSAHKLLLCILGILFFSGCARIGPPLPPSLELARPVRDLRAVRKGDKVHLSWTMPTQTSDGESLQHPGSIRICRSAAAMAGCGTPLGSFPGVIATPAGKHAPGVNKMDYTDTLSGSPLAPPNARYTYAVEAVNSYGRSAGLSNRVQVPAAPAMAPPAGFSARLTAAGVEISWECQPAAPPAPDVSYQLRIYRRAEDSKNAVLAITADPFDCRKAALDQSIEWEKTYFYYAEVVTSISAPGQPEMLIEGDDTPEVKVTAHDVFPPAAPSGLEAVFSGVGQAPFIDLSWKPNTEADLAGYNIYRREDGGEPVKINSELDKEAVYRDGNVQPGKKYFYRVSAVDERGNESGKSEETSEQAH